jgi:uracil-DNA glycosylase family 4
MNWHNNSVIRVIPELKDILTLTDLKNYTNNIDTPLKFGKNLVFGEGDGAYVIIGEAPGADENTQLRPFVGRSGKLLREQLNTLLTDEQRAHISIVNVVPWQPESNRTPTWSEIQQFTPILKQQLYIRKAKAILCLGSVAARAIFADNNVKITNIHGQLQYYQCGNDTIPVICAVHPALVLRNELYLQAFKNDVAKFAEIVKQIHATITT